MTAIEVAKLAADVAYVGGFVLAAFLARPLLGALRDLAMVGRAIVALMGSRETAERAAEERAEARHREAMTALADLKATVIARL